MTTPMNRETRRLRLVLLTLLLTSFTLIALDYRTGHGSPFSIVRRAGAAVFGPIERAFSSAVHPVLHLHVGSDSGQLTKLRDENAQLQAQLRAANSDQRRIAELNSLLGLSSSGGYVTVPARVVAISGALGFEWTATIDAGTRDGIRPDMTVIGPAGLVGRVKVAGPQSSTVVLIVDPMSTVGARIARTGQVGLITGQGDRPLSFTLLAPNGDVHVGDKLVTWGSPGGRPFVPDLIVGRVIAVESTPGALTRTALIRPYIDFGALDLVGVVIVQPRAARHPLPVVPPSPSSGSSPSPAPSASH